MEIGGGGRGPTPARVVVAAAGDDANARLVARILRDAGHEVIWSGGDQAPERIVATAIQEDADAVGLCAGDGAPAALEALDALVALLTEQDAADIVVFGSGVAGGAGPGTEPPGTARLFGRGEEAEIALWVADPAPR